MIKIYGVPVLMGGSKVLGNYCCVKLAIKVGNDANTCCTGVIYLCDLQEQQVRKMLTGAFGGGNLPGMLSLGTSLNQLLSLDNV